MSTNLSFEEIAEDYCAEFSDYNLVEIAKEGVSSSLPPIRARLWRDNHTLTTRKSGTKVPDFSL